MEYRGFYKKYNMSGEISIGSGIVKVHNIFDDIPCFIRKLDCLFVDPPCSNRNLKSFYTKSDLTLDKNIELFNERLFEVINDIRPLNIFIEVFKSNKNTIENLLKISGYEISEYPSYYYNSVKNKCWILHATKNNIIFKIPYIDEEKAIEHICKNFKYNCIGDLCMGKGLVGFYANKYNKKFVGTELNKKRLACLIEHINTNRIIVR